VAARAGVSTTTASYILNGLGEQMLIAAATQERVRAAAQDLNYRPNPSARNLRTSTTRSLGLISDEVAGGQFASQMITGATIAARERSHFMVIGESQEDPDLEGVLIEQMLDQRVDGILYATVITADLRVPASLRDQRVVLLNCFDETSSLPAVLPDDYQGGRSAVEALIEGGVTAGVHVVGARPSAGGSAARLRLDGITDALRSAGAELEPEIACDWTVAEAFEATSAYLADGGDAKGLICMNDRIAMGVYQALSEADLTVPHDVSVVSFDGSDLAAWLRPRLTSVVLPYAEMGARAVEILLDDGPMDARVVRVPMPVSRGQSVAD
jgi:LacI family transcriptional regulator